MTDAAPSKTDRAWFAVRTLCRSQLHGSQSTVLYEERVTVWSTSSIEAAIRLAEQESKDYADATDGTTVGFVQAYELAMAPSHGSEVFSLMRVSDLDASEYVDRFFDTGAERQSD